MAFGDPLAEVSGEEQPVKPRTAQSSQKPQFGHTDVLRLVDDTELERRMGQLRKASFQATEQTRLGQEPALVESV